MPDTPLATSVGQNDDVTPARPRSIRVPDQLWDEFRVVCAEQGEDASDVLRLAMRAYVVDAGQTVADLAAIRGGRRG